MKKIYLSENYVIVEKDGKTYEYAISKTVYTFADQGTVGENLQVVETGVGATASGRLLIPITELTANEWFQEDGITNWDVAGLVTFLRSNTGFNPASGGSGATVTTTLITLGVADFESNLNGGGVQLLPNVPIGKWQNIKVINYKYKGGLLPYFGLDSNNVFEIYGGGEDVKLQMFTTRDTFLQTRSRIWSQFPQTREEQAFLAFNPDGVANPFINVALTARLSREDLIGGDGVLDMEIIWELKDI